ncbi:ABC transporter permease [candidate division LCP-89 bacterium B3_LCP]|uniref:ABC transporter permease n=1 Tax=candidate division LCP-89 bacterium B3_LCP TaxID=2012998 RepID=A0A532V6G4_UNCL8|nr:MAG: ABC transporter permease [candidate division LCP-89 bacterium B3_LCP]
MKKSTGSCSTSHSLRKHEKTLPNERNNAGAKRLTETAQGFILPLLFLISWELIAIWMDNPALVPRLTAVLSVLLHPFTELVGTGSLIWNTVVSLVRVLSGFAVAVVVCVPLGIFMGTSKFIHRLVNPLVELFRPLCPIAWIPFAMAVFKTTTVPQLFGVRYSDTILDSVQVGMIFIIFWGGLFPILLNTIHGVAGVRTIWLETAQMLNASKVQTFRKVVLPAALPAIMTGLRVGLGIAWMVIIAAEMLPGSDSGIGYLIMYSYELAEMQILVACMIVIGLMGLVLNKGLQIISDRVSKWEALER